MNQHPTTMVDNFYLEMMATYTFLQGMAEWQETHLENLEMLRTSRKFTEDSQTQIQCIQLQKLKVKEG